MGLSETLYLVIWYCCKKCKKKKQITQDPNEEAPKEMNPTFTGETEVQNIKMNMTDVSINPLNKRSGMDEMEKIEISEQVKKLDPQPKKNPRI